MNKHGTFSIFGRGRIYSGFRKWLPRSLTTAVDQRLIFIFPDGTAVSMCDVPTSFRVCRTDVWRALRSVNFEIRLPKKLSRLPDELGHGGKIGVRVR